MHIQVNRLPEKTAFFAKITAGNSIRIVPVTLVSRSFDGSPSTMTAEDSVVLAPVDGTEHIVAVRHEKNPNLVLQVSAQEEIKPATETTPAEYGIVLKPSSKRITFMEITPETQKKKDLADEVIRAAEAEAVAAEHRRTLSAQLTGERTNRPRTGASAGASKADLIERAKAKVNTCAKRRETLTADLKKTSDQLDTNITTLKNNGVEVSIKDGVATFTEVETTPEDEAAEA